MIDPQQMKELIIIPVLQAMGKFSPAAVNLMLGTMAQESSCGKYLKQLDDGVALGVFQMELLPLLIFGITI